MSEPHGPGGPGRDDEGRTGDDAREEPGEAAAPPAAPVGWLPLGAEELFGPGAVASEAYEVLTVDVPAAAWTAALQTARDELGCTFFDWLSAVDEPGAGFRVAAHVVAVGTPVRRLLIRTTVPHEAPVLATATGVYAGAAWHERETHEMFGVDFAGHPHLARLLLPEEFEGHPLRKDFVLAARVAKAWPGAKEPGESDHGGPKRRQMQPPGVPDPNEWGPMKGKLPPAPARGPRGTDRPRRTARTTPAETRPPRRARSASEGSASQRPAGTGPAPAGEEPRPRPRTSDAPWQRPGPGDEPAPPPKPAAGDAAPPEPPGPGAPDAPAEPAGDSVSPREPDAGDPGSPSEPAAGESSEPEGGDRS